VITITHRAMSGVDTFIWYDITRNGIYYHATVEVAKPDDLWMLERLNKGEREYRIIRKHLNPKVWAEVLAAITEYEAKR
jgi:hypothetical protein